ncbi:hypothetical protein BZA77DRAFT_90037 [Pyronema omphalodes]|nr:hypothetical protein BZA77DRAFT_90037 [Pyronema omphalodes]
MPSTHQRGGCGYCLRALGIPEEAEPVYPPSTPAINPLGTCVTCVKREAPAKPVHNAPPPPNPPKDCISCSKSDAFSRSIYPRKLASTTIQNNSSNHLSTPQVIGLSLGIALIFLIGLIYWYIMAQKAKKKAEDEERAKAWIPPLPADPSRRVIGGAGLGGLGKDKKTRTMKEMMERGDWHR